MSCVAIAFSLYVSLMGFAGLAAILYSAGDLRQKAELPSGQPGSE